MERRAYAFFTMGSGVNWKVIHMTGTFWNIEITAITGVSFCDAINVLAVIAVIPTPTYKGD